MESTITDTVSFPQNQQIIGYCYDCQTFSDQNISVLLLPLDDYFLYCQECIAKNANNYNFTILPDEFNTTKVSLSQNKLFQILLKIKREIDILQEKYNRYSLQYQNELHPFYTSR